MLTHALSVHDFQQHTAQLSTFNKKLLRTFPAQIMLFSVPPRLYNQIIHNNLNAVKQLKQSKQRINTTARIS